MEQLPSDFEGLSPMPHLDLLFPGLFHQLGEEVSLFLNININNGNRAPVPVRRNRFLGRIQVSTKSNIDKDSLHQCSAATIRAIRETSSPQTPEGRAYRFIVELWRNAYICKTYVRRPPTPKRSGIISNRFSPSPGPLSSSILVSHEVVLLRGYRYTFPSSESDERTVT